MTIIHRFRLLLLHRQANALLRRVRKRQAKATRPNIEAVTPPF